MEDYQAETAVREAPGEGLCKKCAAAPADVSQSPYAVLCRDCRNEQIKYPFPPYIVAFFAILLAACVLSVWQFAAIRAEYKKWNEAKAAYAEKRYHTANKAYQEIYEGKSGKAQKIGEKLFETAILLYDYPQAAEMYSKHLYNRQVSDSEYAYFTPFITRLVKFGEDQQKLEDLGMTNEISVEEGIAKLDALPPEELTPYFQYIKASWLASQGDFSNAAALLEGIASDGDSDYVNVLPMLASCHRRLGKLNSARAYAGQALRKNREDSEALRQLAVAEMLAREYAGAVAHAREAVSVFPEGSYHVDTLALAYYLNGDAEALADLIAFAKEKELLCDSYEEVSRGIKTVEEIYMGGI